MIENYNFDKLRQIKYISEINIIKKGIKILEKSIFDIRSNIILGITEKQLKAKIEYIFKKNGADETSFETIVLFNKKTAFPHGHSENQKLKKGNVVLIDMGTKLNGYCTDLTRMFCIGTNAKFFSTYEKLLDIQINAIKSVNVNNNPSKIENNIIKKLEENNIDKEYYLHSTGHGVGINIHELPFVSYKNKNNFQENEIITIEPGIYFYNKFGIRIEDMILVKKNKSINLTKNIPKDLNFIKV